MSLRSRVSALRAKAVSKVTRGSEKTKQKLRKALRVVSLRRSSSSSTSPNASYDLSSDDDRPCVRVATLPSSPPEPKAPLPDGMAPFSRRYSRTFSGPSVRFATDVAIRSHRHASLVEVEMPTITESDESEEYTNSSDENVDDNSGFIIDEITGNFTPISLPRMASPDYKVVHYRQSWIVDATRSVSASSTGTVIVTAPAAAMSEPAADLSVISISEISSSADITARLNADRHPVHMPAAIARVFSVNAGSISPTTVKDYEDYLATDDDEDKENLDPGMVTLGADFYHPASVTASLEVSLEESEIEYTGIFVNDLLPTSTTACAPSALAPNAMTSDEVIELWLDAIDTLPPPAFDTTALDCLVTDDDKTKKIVAEKKWNSGFLAGCERLHEHITDPALKDEVKHLADRARAREASYSAAIEAITLPPTDVTYPPAIASPLFLDNHEIDEVDISAVCPTSSSAPTNATTECVVSDENDEILEAVAPLCSSAAVNTTNAAQAATIPSASVDDSSSEDETVESSDEDDTSSYDGPVPKSHPDYAFLKGCRRLYERQVAAIMALTPKQRTFSVPTSEFTFTCASPSSSMDTSTTKTPSSPTAFSWSSPPTSVSSTAAFSACGEIKDAEFSFVCASPIFTDKDAELDEIDTLTCVSPRSACASDVAALSAPVVARDSDVAALSAPVVARASDVAALSATVPPFVFSCASTASDDLTKNIDSKAKMSEIDAPTGVSPLTACVADVAALPAPASPDVFKFTTPARPILAAKGRLTLTVPASAKAGSSLFGSLENHEFSFVCPADAMPFAESPTTDAVSAPASECEEEEMKESEEENDTNEEDIEVESVEEVAEAASAPTKKVVHRPAKVVAGRRVPASSRRGRH